MDDDRGRWLRITLLGVLSGLLAGTAVLAFRSAIEWGQQLLLPPGGSGNYEALPPWLRIILPVGVGLALGLLFDRLPRDLREVGVTHVLKRLQAPGRERLPPANMLTQFVGAVVAIVGGHSVDREGPAVHIGAASASFVGQRLRLTAEEDITLAACGSAAAIAAAFDTPLAGVVFAIEVLRIRYQVSRYLPVIVAAVVGAMVSRALTLTEQGFAVVPEYLGSNWEYTTLVTLGCVTGLLAVGFIGLTGVVAAHTIRMRCALSFSLAGLITGILALWTPEIMGTSYDTLDRLLQGQGELLFVVSLMLTKLIATSCAIGLRVPGGLIGPTLFVGGAAGSAVGLAIMEMTPVDTASPGFYATIGMVAMMGATLRAPLAALTALLELTGNPNIILPGMVAVASAELVTRLVRGQKSVFDVLLDVQTRAARAEMQKNSAST
ncbi:MAG: chloride channel protein [Thiohalocapsa sp.]